MEEWSFLRCGRECNVPDVGFILSFSSFFVLVHLFSPTASLQEKSLEISKMETPVPRGCKVR